MPWAYNFFSHTASNTRFLSNASASIFFSSLFSRSRSFNRRASFTSICPNCRFQRWKVTCERLCSRHTSVMATPLSASRKMRIFSSVVYRLPFLVWVLFRPQTNSSTGSKKRSHVTELREAKAEGCPAFRSGRVYTAPLLAWFAEKRQRRAELAAAKTADGVLEPGLLDDSAKDG